MEKISVIGIGKLGLCFALNVAEAGYSVIGVDNREDYVNSLASKSLTSSEPFVKEMLQRSSNFEPTTELSKTIGSSLVFIVVATPSVENGGYDHSQLDQVVDALLELPEPEQRTELIIMATTLPSYCDELQKRISGSRYHVSYNPEFIAQGNIIRNQQFPDQVLIGEADKVAGDKIQEVYENICQNNPTYCRMSRISAEICKLATNCFLTTKISFANSIGDLAMKAGAEPDKILAAVGSDSRIGSKYLGYGFGFGGPCFPRDNKAMIFYGKSLGMEMELSKATDQLNREHLNFQTQTYLNENVPEAPIKFETVTYKPESVLLTESQQLKLAVQLAKEGRNVVIRERQEVIDEVQALYPNLFSFELMD